jgi:uncharacterized protein (TIGR03084 family)
MAETFTQILDDFGAEAADLRALLASLGDDVWVRPTPARGGDVRDSVAHLALGDDLAHECVTTGRAVFMEEAFTAAMEGPEARDALEAGMLEQGRSRSPSEVLAWWTSSNERLRAALAGVDQSSRLPWGPNLMSPASFTTARVMETWAHGLDCFAAAGVEPVDTDRVRHTAFLGLRALPYAFMLAGLPAPGPVRLELIAPSGAGWRFGPDDAPTVITGSASDWCRVATHRDRGDERSRLSATGPDGDAVLANAQAYLGV